MKNIPIKPNFQTCQKIILVRKKKFAPSISQIISAAKRLPSPDSYDKISYSTFIDGEHGKQINFERIKILKPDGTKVVKWSFKGRIMIESKYVGNKEG